MIEQNLCVIDYRLIFDNFCKDYAIERPGAERST
jgi:hypothetical protein